VDVLEFIARSEWPIVVLIALWILHRPLRDMVGRINPTKVDAWGFKAEFERALVKIEALAPSKSDDALEVLTADRRLEFTTIEPEWPISPEAIILMSWARIEAVIRKLMAFGPRSQWTGQIPPFRRAGLAIGLTNDEIDALFQMFKLRNRVAHSDNAPISTSEALRYKDAADNLFMRLVEIERKINTSSPVSSAG
jgi:hypothetical protein